MADVGPPRPESLPPGYDEEDPYAGVDLSTYPEWWRVNIEEFEEYGLRPYRPPRFADGEFTPEVIARFEAEFSVVIRIQSINPHRDNRWIVSIDGEEAFPIERAREGDGFTRYGMTSDEFEAAIRSVINKGETAR